MVHQIKIVVITCVFLFIQSITNSLIAQSDLGIGLEWHEYEEAVELAEKNEKTIMLFMEADWCSVCKRMKREVFPDKEIQYLLNENFYIVSIDIESGKNMLYQQENITQKAFSKQMNLFATPTFIFLDFDETVIGSKPGFMDKNELKQLLEFIYSDAYKSKSFADFQNNF
ncbi:MAG: thioredoxin fold domain-containing protein [Balneolaceae bacterium]